jgi:hypothetical protein
MPQVTYANGDTFEGAHQVGPIAGSVSDPATLSS